MVIFFIKVYASHGFISYLTGRHRTWSARAVLSMLMSSRSAMRRHVCIQLIRLSLYRSRRKTPVLKPRPSAGQGRWCFHSLPRYQSLWFSTRPIACLPRNRRN